MTGRLVADCAKTIRASDAWLAAGMLACVAIATAAIAVAVAFGVTNSPSSTFALGDADGSQENISTAGSAAAAVKQAQANPGLLVRDGDGRTWTAESAEVNLFQASYAGASGGADTVTSADGGGVVAPGTANRYDFDVQNVGDSEVIYTLSAKMTSEATDEKVPLEARVRFADGWLVGGEDEWVPLDELGVLREAVTLGGRQSSAYSLEWRWRFERDDASKGESLADSDSHDTRLGNLHLSQDGDPVANVELNVVASYDEPPEGRVASGSRLLPQTGDRLLGAVVVAAFALAAAAAVLLLLLARRPRGEDKPREDRR